MSTSEQESDDTAVAVLTVTLLLLFNNVRSITAQEDSLFDITQLTETTMELTWMHNPDSSIVQYIITITGPNNQAITRTVDAGTAPQTFVEYFENLDSATEYMFLVEHTLDGNIIPQTLIGPNSFYTRPYPPEAATITQIGIDAVRFDWIPPAIGDFHGYVVVLNNQEMTFLDRNKMSFEVGNLQAGVEYDFGVYTYVGPQDASVWSNLGPTEFIPLAPLDGNVQIDSVTSSSLNVLWDAYADAVAYLVTLVDANNQVFETMQVDGSVTQQAFTGLDPSTFYEARVEVFMNGQAFYSGDSSAQTLPVGTPIGEVNFQSATTDSITISFTEVGADSYEIIYDDNMGNTRTVTAIGSPFTIPNLNPSTDYNIEVYSIVNNQQELIGNTQGRTDDPNVNINPVVTNIGTSSFTITWEDISNLGFTEYLVTYVNENGVMMQRTVPAIPGLTPTADLRGLNPGQQHDVTITGTRNNMMVDISVLVQFTQPLPPGEASFMQIDGTSNIQVTWTQPLGDVTNYVITYVVDGTTWQKIVDSTTTSTIITEFVEGQTQLLTVSSASGVDVNNLVESDPLEPRQVGSTDFIINPATNPCSPNPCQNQGECTGISTTVYVCTCPVDFGGTNCETSIISCIFNQPCDDNCYCEAATCSNQTSVCSSDCRTYGCPLTIRSQSLSQVNPQSSVKINCILEGSILIPPQLNVRLSRSKDQLNTSGVDSVISSGVTGQREESTNTVENVCGDDVFYCILSQDNGLNNVIIGSVNVTGFAYELPSILDPPAEITKSTTSITISWRSWDQDTDVGDPPVVAYIPYYRMNTSQDWINGSVIPANQSLEYTASILESDRNYNFAIATVREGEGGEGPRGPQISIKTLCTELIAGSVSASITDFSDVSVSWKLPENVYCSTGITQFTIYYDIEGDITTTKKAGTTDKTTQSFIVDGFQLESGTTYYFYVTVTTDQEGAFSETTEDSQLLFEVIKETRSLAVYLVVLVIPFLLLCIVVVIIFRRFRRKPPTDGKPKDVCDANYYNAGVTDDPEDYIALDEQSRNVASQEYQGLTQTEKYERTIPEAAVTSRKAKSQLETEQRQSNYQYEGVNLDTAALKLRSVPKVDQQSHDESEYEVPHS